MIMVNEADSIGGDADIRIALKETSEQRDGFRENVDVLMAEVLRLREQSTTLQDHLSATERSHNEARSQWAAKLEQAQHEFSDMLTREDLEAMREDLVQQTEAPWKARVKALETELATARESASAHRREAERARTALDSAAHEHRASLRELEVKHGATVADLRAKLEMLEANEASTESDDALRSGLDRSRRLQREHAEATIRSQKLLEEVEELRQENDVLLQMRTELLSAQAGLQGELKAQVKLCETERASYERRASHLQHELDTAASQQQRMLEAALQGEAEMRSLRAQIDDAQHQVSTERAAAALRLAEAQREVGALRLEMDRRHAEALRREALLHKSRDELASAVAAAEREASAAIAVAHDEETARAKRLEDERTRLSDALVAAQSDAAATHATQRDRSDALQGECAALKAQVHGAHLEKQAALDEASRLRRRMEEAEEHLSSTMAELHAIRIASSETDASRGKLAEVEAAATVMTEKLSIQLASAQKEAESVRAKAAVEVEHLTAKLKQVKKLASKERHAQQQTEAVRARQLEALKHEATRLRHEREQLKRQVREGRLAVGGGGGGGAVAGGGGAFGGELKRLLVAETALVEEASALKLQAAGITA